jgi:hypothetical protein
VTRPKNPPYAWGTDVPAERSRGEIESTLQRFGADQFGYGVKPDSAVIEKAYATGKMPPLLSFNP